MLLGFDDYEMQSRNLAGALDMPWRTISRHCFPDGEVKLSLPTDLPDRVIICRSLDRPNEKLVELLLAAETARELGAKAISLVAPYLCYMRQDKAFHPGEAVSQRVIGAFLAGLFDNVITVDPHLHRIHHLQQAVPTGCTMALTATSLMAEFLRGRIENPVLIGPDSEAEQWVSSVASTDRWSYGICKKTRLGDQEVVIRLPDIDLNGRSVVLVDDVASSGQTLATAAEECMSRTARHVDVLVTHGLFYNDAQQLLKRAGVRHIWSTDSVTHESNIIPLNGLLKDAVLKLP